MLDLLTPLPSAVDLEFKATVLFANRVSFCGLNVAGATTTIFAELSCLLAQSGSANVPHMN
jgi:hypothetical protein